MSKFILYFRYLYLKDFVSRLTKCNIKTYKLTQVQDQLKLRKATDHVISNSPNHLRELPRLSKQLLMHRLCYSDTEDDNREPCQESNSSTSIAVKFLPFALIFMFLRHQLPPLYHPMDRATTSVPSAFLPWCPSISTFLETIEGQNGFHASRHGR